MQRSAHEFHDETLRPSQHYMASRSRIPADGERRLMLAILQDALASYEAARRKDDLDSALEIEELDEWFAEPDEDYIFSFRSICSFLEVRPERVLEMVKRCRWNAMKDRRGRRTALDEPVTESEPPAELARAVPG